MIKKKRIRNHLKMRAKAWIFMPVLVCVCLVLALLGGVPVGAAASAVKGGALETITVGVPGDRCPVFYLDDETDEVIGIGADIFRIAARNAGYEPVYKLIEEATLMDALDNAAYDIVMPFGSAVSSASGKTTIISDNIINTTFTLVTVSNRKFPPLSELRVGMLHSLMAGAETVKERFPGIQINLYETVADCVDALRSGEVEALLHNSYVWSYILQKPSYSDLLVQPADMFTMDFRVGTPDTPEGRKIIDRLNGGIAALTELDRQSVVLDYTTRRLYKNDFFDYLYQYWVVFLMGGLLIVTIALIVILRWRTLRFKQEEEMRQLINQDLLTGTYSLRGFRKQVEEQLKKYPDAPYILFYNNIKSFKYINDSYGMDTGDDLLCFLADQITDNLHEGDVIGRIEADHFAVLHRLEEGEDVSLYEEVVLEPVRAFLIDQGKETRVQLCAGVYALTPADHRTINVDRMIDFARVAEQRVRENHKEGIEFYNPDQWNTGRLMADVAGHLSVAIETGEIQVWYQPQVNYETGEISGLEALCRWKHARRGWISPAEFIPALEEAGLIYDLDSFVWEKVCTDLRRWNKMGITRSVSVNLSRADITKNQKVPEHFCELVRRYLLTPDQLRVEITETAYVENPDLLILTTKRFREYGFQVEMDDFGSGYSSLNMLKEVQVDRIKMDLHFLTETGDAEKGRVIIKHMIRMARALGINLITEGVEKEEQAEFLKKLGCAEMQGYFFYRPMPAEELEGLDGNRPCSFNESVL